MNKMALCVISFLAIQPSMSVFAKSADLILKSADSNINTMSKDGEVVSMLNGNVQFLYDDATIQSQYAKWWKTKGIVSFSDNVKVVRTKQTMTSDKMDYDKNKKQLIAEGHLIFNDLKEHVRLTGNRGTYAMDSKFLVVEGKPHFEYFDSTAHDTVDIVGTKMTYSDSLKKATVEKAVRIKKGKLVTHSDLAIYFPDSGKAHLRTVPQIAFETDSLFGDSVDLLFTKNKLQKVKVRGNSHGLYRDFGTQDTTLTQLFGDSLSMFMSDSGKIDSLYATGNVKSKYAPVKKPKQANEAFGKYMMVSFNRKNQVDKVRVWGNAQSVYNVEEKDGRGMNTASGDSIRVSFANGKAANVRLSGSVRGYYAPLPMENKSNANQTGDIIEKVPADSLVQKKSADKTKEQKK